MSRPLRIEFAGGLYHVTSRGDGREAIFLAEEDRGLFLGVLSEVVPDFNWAVHAYCLMDNHYHQTLSGLSMANEAQQIERRQRVPVRDAEIVQGTGNLHHHIGDSLFGEPKNIFDNSAPLDSGNGVFDFHAHAGEHPIEYFIATAELLTFGLFFGWLMTIPSGS